ncbi:hypothetical protein EV356DRAFT_504715 [Viridothelium virens]|uniref:Uncharacterized protein n=1 Tax=Viridothelium virens TaxID=1048519 RepID=A0A6A6H4E1_VIRVR|nr:hypothetical protein EV356DRAFT_504715 [Viridothelium virens]
MSNQSNNRWREGRPQSLNAPPPQQHQRQQQHQAPSHAQTDRANATASPRPGSQSQSRHTPSASQGRAPLASQAGNTTSTGNAWGAEGGDKGRAAVMSVSGEDKAKVLGTGKEFNGDEVRSFLRRDVVPEGVEMKKGAASSARSGLMGNGQDFWTVLRKQVTDLEQGKR